MTNPAAGQIVGSTKMSKKTVIPDDAAIESGADRRGFAGTGLGVGKPDSVESEGGANDNGDE